MRSPSPVPLPPNSCDALLLVSFGGPEGPDDVMPFLENVVRGKNVPRERLLEVAQHYELFDGVSPINGQYRALLAALVAELNAQGPQLPVYWGNRNWHPMLADAIGQMAEDGVRRALAFVTSPFGSYPGCRQYLEDIERARQEVGPTAPTDRQAPAVLQSSRLHRADGRTSRGRMERDSARATRSGTPALHRAQHSGRDGRAFALRTPVARGVSVGASAVACGIAKSPNLQISKSGMPKPRLPKPQRAASQPLARARHPRPYPPIARRRQSKTSSSCPSASWPNTWKSSTISTSKSPALCDELGINMVRAGVVANHPRLVQMIRELVVERLDPASPRLALGPTAPGPTSAPPTAVGRRAGSSFWSAAIRTFRHTRLPSRIAQSHDAPNVFLSCSRNFAFSWSVSTAFPSLDTFRRMGDTLGRRESLTLSCKEFLS